MQKLTTLIGIACVACTLTSTKAEASSLFELSLRELLQVKVTIANLSEQTSADAAASVTVYTREDIRRMGIGSLEELLNYVPGVQTARTQQEFSSQAPIFRGNTGQNGTSPSILLMIDGRRLNSHVHGGAFESPLNNLDWVKQVEIIRGPGSTLYGANAFMGVINLITDIKPGELSIRAGSLNTRDFSLQYQYQWKGIDTEIFFHDYRDNGENYSPFYQFIGSFDATQDPRSRRTYALKLNYENWSLDSYYSNSTADDFILGSTLGNDINRQDIRITSHRATYEALNTSLWNVDVYAEYMSATTDFFIRIIPADVASAVWWADGSALDAIGGNHLAYGFHQGGLDGNHRLNDNHKLTFGLEYRNEQVDDNPVHGNWIDEVMRESLGTTILPCECISRGFWLGGVQYDFLEKSDRDVANLWIQDQFKLGPNVDATLGIRYDHYEDFGGHSSIRASLVYQHSENVHMKILYGEAFRAPAFIDTRSTPASNFAANPDLKPELISTIDVVWQVKLRNSEVILTRSHSSIKDEVNLFPLNIIIQEGVTVFQPQNGGRSTLKNWELEWTQSLSEKIIFRGGLTHHNDFVSVGSAQTLAFFAINYSVENLNVNLNGFYHDEVLSRQASEGAFSEDINLKDFWRLNFTATYKMNPKTNIQFQVKNLFDKDYKSHTTADGGLEYGLPNRGRTLSLGLNWRF